MKIIALYKNINGYYDAFILPAWAGNHIVEAKIIISDEDLSDYDLPIFTKYKSAHKYAYTQIMSEEQYLSMY